MDRSFEKSITLYAYFFYFAFYDFRTLKEKSQSPLCFFEQFERKINNISQLKCRVNNDQIMW